MSLPVPDTPTRNRSASTGDSGLPQHEHKRPRLSDVQGEPPTVGPAAETADIAADSPKSTEPYILHSQHAQPDLNTRPQSPPATETEIVTSPTSSKVTINTRPLSSQSSNHTYSASISAKMDGDESSKSPSQSSTTTAEQLHSATSVDKDNQQDTISVASSEDDTLPPIQVAAPEDYDQDHTETRWEPVATASSAKRVILGPTFVQRTFPYADNVELGSAHKVIGLFSTALIHGTDGDAMYFSHINKWLQDLVRDVPKLDRATIDAEYEFWESLPQLVTNLLKRNVGLSDEIDVNDLITFFIGFIQLTKLIAEVETSRFESYPSNVDGKLIRTIITPGYTLVCRYFFMTEGIPLYQVLASTLDIGSAQIVESVADGALDSRFDLFVRSLADLFDAMSVVLPKKLTLVDQAMILLQHCGLIAKACMSRLSDANDRSESTTDAVRASMMYFLDRANAVLERAVVKQHPWLTIENWDAILSTYDAFIGNLTEPFPESSRSIVAFAGVDPENFNPVDLASLAHLAWRFSTLQKFVKSGRMELRVCGIGTMTENMVKIYHDFISLPRNDRNHPTVRFMVRFIRDNELIRYIIGVDSHPQIINRSHNVVGFLCVSHTYTDEDTDVIWNTAMACQDPRAGAEILNVLQHNLDNLDFKALHYITLKVLDLPFSRVNQAVLDFACRILLATCTKLQQIGLDAPDAASINIATLKLCIHLIRQANIPHDYAGDIASRVRQFVPDQIKFRLEQVRNVVGSGPLPEDLHIILQDLCVDLKTHSLFACGSVFATGVMLRSLDDSTSVELIHELSLAQLVVKDMAHLSEPNDVRNSNRSHWMDFDCYFSTLSFLILQTPDCFDEALLDCIWDNLLSSKQPQAEIRARSWSSLASVLDSTRADNSVLDMIISKYLPQLVPQEFDEAVLHCMQQSVRYESRTTIQNPYQGGDDVIAIPGIERVWTMMLESPPNTIETAAADFVIREYLDSTTILGSPLSNAEATHLALIERCVRQVIDAASQISEAQDGSMVDETSKTSHTEDMIETQGLKFYRSLYFLKRFLEALKTRPRFTPSNPVSILRLLSDFQPKGDSIELKLQIHSHPSLPNQITRWLVGSDNTASEIWEMVSRITGWSQFTLIHQGARVEFKGNDSTLRDSNCAAGMLMVGKTAGTIDSTPARTLRGASLVDSKVMHHFDALYRFLDLSNEYAREVYEFLIIFSSQEDTLGKLRAMKTPAQELLQVEKPYKLMYFLRALRSSIEVESFNTQPDAAFLVYAVKTVVSTLDRFDGLRADTTLRMTIIHGLMEALLLAFKAKVSEDIGKSYITDHTAFCCHIMNLWSEVQSATHTSTGLPPVQTLIKTPLEVTLEALLHDEDAWPSLPRDVFTQLLFNALLRNPQHDVRQAILDVIYGLTGNGPVKSYAKAIDVRAPRARFPASIVEQCLTHLWGLFAEIIPDACDHTETCPELFDAGIAIFKVVGKKLSAEALTSYAHQWKKLLLDHHHQQNIGYALHDHTIGSLGKLLLECLTLNNDVARKLSESDSFGRDLFQTFLFPPLSDDTTCNNDPVLDTSTRQILYDLVLAVSTTAAGMEAVVTELQNDLVPKDYFFKPIVSNDRQALRSDAGYAGLRNLSNTCYLNSLFSQLFMNVEFRDLIMGADITDESKQKLVVELGKVFAHMQDSYEDAVSPEHAVDAITQWDGENIDVTIQMDVDEFFNLLFDRLEFQILDRDARNHFKSIYGGQLVQQIKSKECEHVSETLEPFSAVQVEIKGKASLEESLKAYVEGEVLQGENKYSCTGCGKHVDAVKRACLKDVPDHLIFNLKRFDYDIMTGMRCKVNDEFQFPTSVDMGPYQLEALSNPGTPTKQDLFELVGIIVHSGTAESGHYYSYIRKRPCPMSRDNAWVQFNDQDVTRFDPATIGDCCFGGIDYSTIQCPKFYNGYMLFYQRTSSLDAFGVRYGQQDQLTTTRLEFSEDLEQHIAQQNELYLRSYVAQDPIHAKFVKSLLQRIPTGDNNKCSSDHHLETQLIDITLDYVNTISARWKELPEVDVSLKLLETYAINCENCAKAVIKWLNTDSNFGDNVVRCCYPSVRKLFCHVIGICWQSLSESNNHNSLLATTSTDDEYVMLLTDFARTVYGAWDTILRHGRAWEQYFGILSALTKLGDEEARTVIDQGFLERTMELVHLHVPSPAAVKRLKLRYQAYLMFKEKNRPYGHHSLLQFLADLLPHVVMDAPIEGSNSRVQIGSRFGLTSGEAALFELGRPNHMHWLRKIILGSHNLTATDTIVAYIAKVEKLNPLLCECLKDGLLTERQIANAVSFLRPSLVFISEAVSEDAISTLVEAALESIETTGGQYGREYLDFLSHLLTAENQEIPFAPGALQDFILQAIKQWAPILLMQPNDMHADVRGETLDFLKDVLFHPLEVARGTSRNSQYQTLLKIVAKLLDACAQYAQKTFLSPMYKDPSLELQAGQANHVLQVVETYLPLMVATAADEESASRISSIMEELKIKSDSLVDDMTSASEWKASSDLEALSDADLSETST